jgi:CheY-like chemotaxis protein
MAAVCAKPETARRVLVVEDDAAVGQVMADILAPLGLQVVTAHTDRAAYDMIATLPPFSAILLDVNLGAGTTGFDVARFARQALPDVAVIYVTGQASPESFKAFGVPDSVFVAKPFTAESLLEAVRSRLPAND